VTVGELRYDPTRLHPLRSRAAAAYQHLRAATSDDPAAASALRVAAGVRAGLELGWLPAIDRVLSSDAMLTWFAAGPAWLRGRAGAELGRELAARAVELCRDSRDEPVAAMLAALRLASDDDEAMRTLFRELGPDGLLELLTSLATADPTSTELPVALRSAFVETAAGGGLRLGFARELVDVTARVHERSGHRGEHALTLAYLLSGDQLPTTFLVEAAQALIDVERQYATDHDLDVSGGWTLWTIDGFRPPSALATEFADPDIGGATAVAAGDPIYALLTQLAGDGRAGRVVFRNRERAAYLFAHRDVLSDGGEAVVAAAATAAAGPDVGPGAPPRVLEDASLVASGFVNHFGLTNAARADDAVGLAVARIVGAHVFAVDVALSSPDVTDEERLTTLAPDDRTALEDAGLLTDDGARRDLALMATGELRHDVLGPDDVRRAAVLQRGPLEAVLSLAPATDASTQLLRDAVATYQRGLASAAASRLAAGEIADPGRYLAEVMGDAARLEARFVEHIGHRAERRGRDADATLAFWIRAAGEGAERLGGMLGKPGAAVVRALADPAADLAVDRFADAEREGAADADELARLAAEQLAYVWYRELHNAGVITADLPDDLAPDGTLPSYSELVRRVYERPDWTVERVFHALDVAPSDAGVDLDGQALRDALAVAQLPAYQELD
jgi:hypothetical protein